MKHLALFPILDPSAGGIYQYSLMVLKAVEALCAARHLGEITVFYRPGDQVANFSAQFSGFAWQLAEPLAGMDFKKGKIDRIRAWIGEGSFREAWRSLRDRITPGWRAPDPDIVSWKPDLVAWLNSLGVDALVFTAPDPLAFEIPMPALMAVHDLQHRLHPEFPEVGELSQWKAREKVFRNAARSVHTILVDSETGKRDFLQFYGDYGATEEQVFVLPYLPAQYYPVQVLEDQVETCSQKYRIQKPYLFYPAQFWPHKNHLRIAQAMDLLKRENGIAVNLVCSGGSSGRLRQTTLAQFERFVKNAGLSGQVSCLGYVPEEDMPALYAGSWGLVMPTFFGPTNIPPLEAWAYGCPVVTSDLPGIREQSGDAAILVDPADVPSIAEGMRRVWVDADLRTELIERGVRRLAQYTPQDFEKRLANALEHLLQPVEA